MGRHKMKPPKSENQRGTTTQEAGHLGGSATRDKHGFEHYSRIGKIGRALQIAADTENQGKTLSAMGGNECLRRHGKGHFAEIGRKGGRRVQQQVAAAKLLAKAKAKALKAEERARVGEEQEVTEQEDV